jgi:predicted ATPase
MTLVPELLMHKGDLLSAGTDDERARAEALYHQAFELARDLGAAMWQLRAATRLCRHARERGDPSDGDHLLRPVYESFTEGFTIPDLVEARELLKG